MSVVFVKLLRWVLQCSHHREPKQIHRARMSPTKDAIQAIYNRTPCFGEYGNVSLQRVIIAMNDHCSNHESDNSSFRRPPIRRYSAVYESEVLSLSPNALKIFIMLEMIARYNHMDFDQLKGRCGLTPDELFKATKELLDAGLVVAGGK